MLKNLVRTFASGFLMGSADVVPGVSGGTIALVLGIYERLITSIRSGSSAIGGMLRFDWAEARRQFQEVEWPFLLTLLAGIVAAILTLAHFIGVQLEEQPVVLAAAFFGLVVGSVIIAFGLLKNRTATHIAIALVVGVLVFGALGLGNEAASQTPGQLVLFGSGALAICAMILPGISGSLILVLIGMYGPVLDAVNERDFVAVGIFALGAVVGLALFSQILDRALRRAHDVVLAALIGLMVGSLRILWPWPNGVDSSALDGPDGQLGRALVAALVGAVFVVLVARIARPDEG